MTGLRPYQQECIDAVVADYHEGFRQLLVVMATGTGKTVIFSELIGVVKKFLPGRALVFAHREELVDQAIESIRRANPTLKVGKEMASDRADDDCEVVVSCVASIGRAGSGRLNRFAGGFDFVVCDEAHHSIAQTYLNVFDATGVLHVPNGGTNPRLLLGFTATPKRKNRKRTNAQQLLDNDELISLASVYQKISYTYAIRKAIKDGWLVPLRGFRLKTETDLSEVKTSAGDYQQDELSDAVNNPSRNAQIVKAWEDNCENRKTIGFTVDINHAKELAKAFQEKGHNFKAIWGADPDRRDKLEAHQRGDITGLLNAQLLTEGYDDPSVSCAILCAPTKNASKYTQEVGRVTRISTGKPDAIILDVVDNNKRCSLVTFPSLLGLNPEFDLQGASVTHAVEQLEELQEKYPGISLSALTDLSKIEAYVESIDIFSDPTPDEAKEHSKLAWLQEQDGGYVIAIPEAKALRDMKKFSSFLHEKLHLRYTELDEWQLSLSKYVFAGATSTVQEDKLGTFKDLKEGFETADDVLRRCRGDRVKLMYRETPWGDSTASEAQKKFLKRLAGKKNVVYCLCEGFQVSGKKCTKCGLLTGITTAQASQAINRLQHGR